MALDFIQREGTSLQDNYQEAKLKLIPYNHGQFVTAQPGVENCENVTINCYERTPVVVTK